MDAYIYIYIISHKISSITSPQTYMIFIFGWCILHIKRSTFPYKEHWPLALLLQQRIETSYENTLDLVIIAQCHLESGGTALATCETIRAYPNSTGISSLILACIILLDSCNISPCIYIVRSCSDQPENTWLPLCLLFIPPLKNTHWNRQMPNTSSNRKKRFSMTWLNKNKFLFTLKHRQAPLYHSCFQLVDHHPHLHI